MIAENIVVNMELHEEIEITCKKCNETQKYHPRSNKIPKRPKTQCQNEKCGAWIYFDGSLLVKDDQRPKNKNDQKKDQKKLSKPKQELITTQKPETQTQSNLTKTNDQMTKPKTQARTIKENRTPQEVVFIDQMSQEVKIFGRTIPLDKVREIARKTLENSRNMIKGIKYYLNAWESRYKRYLEEKPNNFLIDEFENMQKTLDFLKEMNKLNEKLKNREGVD